MIEVTMMSTSDKWLVVALVVSIIVLAIMIVISSYLFPGSSINIDSIASSVFTWFMFGKMLLK